MKPVSVIAVVLPLIFLAAYSFNAIAARPKCPVHIEADSKLEEKSPAEKIAFAKRLLQLPPDAPKGLLWHTYMSRLYGVAIDATLDEMEQGQVVFDLRDHLRFAGLPDWCPYQCISLKENFEQNVMGKLVARHLYGMSPFASQEELESQAMRKYRELGIEAMSEADRNDWYKSLIVKAFWLPKDVTNEQAWEVMARSVHIFGGAYSQKAIDRIYQQRRLEEALLVLGLPVNTEDRLARSRMADVVEAIHLESPEKPLRFNLCY